jgi:organic hydroperoxide reductase OsmC/OhrA
MAIDKALYTATATSTGGRTGSTRSSDGRISLPADRSITAEVSIGPLTGKAGAFGIAVKMAVSVPGRDRAALEALVAAVHEVCPHSNATRGHIDVDFSIV